MSYKILSIRIDFDLCFNENVVLILQQFSLSNMGGKLDWATAASPDHLYTLSTKERRQRDATTQLRLFGYPSTPKTSQKKKPKKQENSLTKDTL